MRKSAIAAATLAIAALAPRVADAGTGEFEFWQGEWQVQNRFREADSGRFRDEGEARANVYALLGGKAVLELWDGTVREGRRQTGFSLRYPDAQSGEWRLALVWPQPEQLRLGLLSGRFRHGRGEFSVELPREGEPPLLIRYTFSDIAADRLRWNDGYSTDGGVTWRTDWIMEFSRSGPPAALPGGAAMLPTASGDPVCRSDPFARLVPLEGQWRDGALRLRARPVIGHCALLVEIDGDGPSRLQLLTWLPARSRWALVDLDDRPGTGLSVLLGEDADDGLMLRGEDGLAEAAFARRGEALNLALTPADGPARSWTLRREP
jgi:hypothetical protein